MGKKPRRWRLVSRGSGEGWHESGKPTAGDIVVHPWDGEHIVLEDREDMRGMPLAPVKPEPQYWLRGPVTGDGLILSGPGGERDGYHLEPESK